MLPFIIYYLCFHRHGIKPSSRLYPESLRWLTLSPKMKAQHQDTRNGTGRTKPAINCVVLVKSLPLSEFKVHICTMRNCTQIMYFVTRCSSYYINDHKRRPPIKEESNQRKPKDEAALSQFQGLLGESSLHGKQTGKQWKQCQTLFWGAPESLQMVTAAMKLKHAYSLEGQF